MMVENNVVHLEMGRRHRHYDDHHCDDRYHSIVKEEEVHHCFLHVASYRQDHNLPILVFYKDHNGAACVIASAVPFAWVEDHPVYQYPCVDLRDNNRFLRHHEILMIHMDVHRRHRHKMNHTLVVVLELVYHIVDKMVLVHVVYSLDVASLK
jgi:hypothetical protein